jgi:peroxiredoxin Q/BCP
MEKLKAGDKAPAFDLPDQNGGKVKLSDFSGRTLLVFFYPKADTSGCTKQACSVRDAQPDFSAAGVAVVGISPDKPGKQNTFDQKNSLGFPLLSDPEHTVAQAYGAWGTKKMFGKTYDGLLRSAFLIDGEGTVLKAWYNVKPLDTAPKVLTALAELTH